MSLLAVVDSLEGLDESTAALYRAEGERFVLDIEPVDGFALENVTGLKAALQSERTAKDEAVKLAKAFEGLDPSTVREALEKVESMKNWTPDDKLAQQIEAKTKEVASSKQAEIDALMAKLGATTNALGAVTIERELVDAATKANFVAPKLAPKLFGDDVKLREVDGVFAAVVVDAKGEPRTQVTANGDIVPFTIGDYVLEQSKRPEYAALIKGNPASGTGNPKQLPKGQRQGDDDRFKNYNAVDKLAAAMGG